MKSQNYVKRFSRFKNQTAVREVRNLLTKKSLEQWEIASLANLCPETAEEAKALIPSLAIKFTDEELELVLNDLRNYASF
jgi:DNA-directed RNA polymerase II subunit RPB4